MNKKPNAMVAPSASITDHHGNAHPNQALGAENACIDHWGAAAFGLTSPTSASVNNGQSGDRQEAAIPSPTVARWADVPDQYLDELSARRRARLQQLIDQESGGNVTQFADARAYSRSAMYQFLSPNYNNGRSIGEAAARSLEHRCGLPFGWLDQDDATEGDAVNPVSPLARDLRQLAAQLAAQREMMDAAARAGAVEAMQTRSAPVPAQAGTPLPTNQASVPESVSKYIFDAAELQPGELYAGVVKNGSIARHLILMPAEARGVTWHQARTFAALVGGELPDLDDYEVLVANLREKLDCGDDVYWSSEGLHNGHVLYLDFSENPYRDWDSPDSPMRARAVRRIFAGEDHSVVVSWNAHIKIARQANRMTQERLAELVDVSTEVIERFESGKVRSIDGPMLMNLCAVLRIDPAWLLGADDV